MSRFAPNERQAALIAVAERLGRETLYEPGERDNEGTAT